VALAVKARGHGYETLLLDNILKDRIDASVAKFDTFHLVDFRETLLIGSPIQVRHAYTCAMAVYV
jgi:hypothetical protein